jgi:hypothetical protein
MGVLQLVSSWSRVLTIRIVIEMKFWRMFTYIPIPLKHGEEPGRRIFHLHEVDSSRPCVHWESSPSNGQKHVNGPINIAKLSQDQPKPPGTALSMSKHFRQDRFSLAGIIRLSCSFKLYLSLSLVFSGKGTQPSPAPPARARMKEKKMTLRH